MEHESTDMLLTSNGDFEENEMAYESICVQSGICSMFMMKLEHNVLNTPIVHRLQEAYPDGDGHDRRID